MSGSLLRNAHPVPMRARVTENLAKHWGLRIGLALLFCALMIIGCVASPGSDQQATRGSEALPLRVLLVPADGGTQDGTIADFLPVFNAISKQYDLHFDLRVGQSYAAVVEGMVNEKVDIAFFGAVTYHQARQRGAAELLAVGVTKGESVYYSGIFVNTDAGLEQLSDLKGKSIAFGDINSTSSFNFPLAMLLAADIDPIHDLSAVYLTGSHANSLAALSAGKADAASASLSSFEKAVANGHVDPTRIRVLARSEPIPYPPLAMHPELDVALKSQLKAAFQSVHEQEAITPDMIRGYGGKRVDRYSTEVSESDFAAAMQKLSAVTDEIKAEILKKAATQGRSRE